MTRFQTILLGLIVGFTPWGCQSQPEQHPESTMKNQLQVGDTIPLFELQNQLGEWVKSSDLIGEKVLVIYFYPKDDTPGCTKEACRFRDDYEDFMELGAEVIGVSSDSVTDHAQFAEKYQLPFTLLSDPGGSLRRAFGVPTNLLGLLPGRVTYIIDLDGRIAGMYNSQLNAVQHVDEALQVIRGLKKH